MICVFSVFSSFSPALKQPEKNEFGAAIKQAILKLESKPGAFRPSQSLFKVYSQADGYYQNKIKRLQSGDDSLKWAKILDLMLEMNGLSKIIKNSTDAIQVIPEPRMYQSEISEIKPKAVDEWYISGTNSLKMNTVEGNKQAFLCFKKVAELSPGYKELNKKIAQAKDLSTTKVVVEDIRFYSNTLSLVPDKFYKELIFRLQYAFPYEGFVNFYSTDEENKLAINMPEFSVQLEIENFKVGPVYTTTKNFQPIAPSKKLELVNGKYVWIQDASTVTTSADQSTITVHQVNVSGTILMKIISVGQNKVLYTDHVSCQCMKEKSSTYNGSFGYQETRSPETQEYFDLLFISNIDQVLNRLSDFFDKYK